MNAVCLFTLYRQQLASFPLNSQLMKQLVSNTQEACWNSDGELRQELKMASALLKHPPYSFLWSGLSLASIHLPFMSSVPSLENRTISVGIISICILYQNYWSKFANIVMVLFTTFGTPSCLHLPFNNIRIRWRKVVEGPWRLKLHTANLGVIYSESCYSWRRGSIPPFHIVSH